MKLSQVAQKLSQELKLINQRLDRSSDLTQRYQLFKRAMNDCANLENHLGTIGVSLLKVMENNRLMTGEELYRSLFSELPGNIDGKHEISGVIRTSAFEIAKIKNAQIIYYYDEVSGKIRPATDSQIDQGFDQLIKACDLIVAKAQIK